MKKTFPSIFAIDFEGSKKSGIVEFGVVELLPSGQIGLAQTSLCAPRAPLNQKEAALTGIDNSLAARCAPFEEHLDFFAKLRSVGVFAAHNAQTEDSLLRFYAPVIGFVPDFFSGAKLNTWAPWLDTLVLSRNAGLADPKLSKAIADLGLGGQLDTIAQTRCPSGRAKWHCALYDAIASALIIKTALECEALKGASLAYFGALCGVRHSGQESIF